MCEKWIICECTGIGCARLLWLSLLWLTNQTINIYYYYLLVQFDASRDASHRCDARCLTHWIASYRDWSRNHCIRCCLCFFFLFRFAPHSNVNWNASMSCGCGRRPTPSDSKNDRKVFNFSLAFSEHTSNLGRQEIWDNRWFEYLN